MIGRDYQKELSLKDISKDLFINPVYLGQLIKRETNSTFAELLNKQRIKAAQQLLLSTSDSIEDICYAVGYSNVDISIRFSVNCAENHRKLIGNKLKLACKSCIPVQKNAIMFKISLEENMKKNPIYLWVLLVLSAPHFIYVIIWNLESIAK